MEAKRLVDLGRSCRLVQIATSSLFRFVLNICDDFLARRNILPTNQITNGRKAIWVKVGLKV